MFTLDLTEDEVAAIIDGIGADLQEATSGDWDDTKWVATRRRLLSTLNGLDRPDDTAECLLAYLNKETLGL